MCEDKLNEKHDSEECSCGCGHHHHHEQHHHEHHCHDGNHHEHEHSHQKKTIYILENLGCANCAAKMERQIQQLPEIEMATITFATKQLAIAAENPEKLLPEIQRICSSIESEVLVIPKDKTEKETRKKVSIWKEHAGDIEKILAGVVLFIVGLVTDWVFIYTAAYVLLGLEIIKAALKNLTKGHVFDENFLMSVATFAAFVIGDFAEAVGIILFYRIGELFEEIAVSRSRSQIMEAVDMRPEVVNVVHDGYVKEIPAEEAKAGDVILVRPGDRIPLDGKVMSGQSRLDTSPVTGESVPVHVYPGVEIYSGCVNDQGVLKVEVTKPLQESMVSRILNSVENAAASKPKIDRFITRFARIYTPIVVVAAVLTAIIPSLITGDWRHWVYTAITFLVISCPCALVLSVPLAFFSGIGAGSKQGILFKGGLAIEALKEVKAVVMDKTGTITKGNFVVQSIHSYGRFTEKQVLTMAADCELSSTHPIGKSIVDAAREKKYRLVSPVDVQEFSGKGIKASFPEAKVLCGNREFLLENGVDLTKVNENSYGTEVLLAIEGKIEGSMIITDVIKPDSAQAIHKMKKMNLLTAILTGDAKESAVAVAKETGIEEVHAQLLPQEKLEHLQDIRRRRGAVLFVGDGINDAPVLAGADVGAAMGSGADAAIEAADVVFMNSSLEAIPEAIHIAKKTGNIAMQNVVFALAIKFLVMILGFAGFANMWMAVFADTGVAIICVLNSIRAMKN